MPKTTHWICDRCGTDVEQNTAPAGWADLTIKSVFLRDNQHRTPGSDKSKTVSPQRALLCDECWPEVIDEAKGENQQKASA